MTSAPIADRFRLNLRNPRRHRPTVSPLDSSVQSDIGSRSRTRSESKPETWIRPRSSCMFLSVISDPRIERRVHDVSDEVRENDEEPGEQGDRHDDVDLALVDRV